MTRAKSPINIMLLLTVLLLWLVGSAHAVATAQEKQLPQASARIVDKAEPEQKQKKSPNGKEKLAVLDLEGVEVDTNLAYSMSVMLRDELHSYGQYEVLSREDLQAIAKRLSMQQAAGDECADDVCLVSYGRALGTRYMVAGVLSKVGSMYLVSLRLIDTDGDNPGVMNRISERCKCSQEELFDTVSTAAAKLMGRGPAAATLAEVSAVAVSALVRPPVEVDPNTTGSAILSVSSEPAGATVWLGTRNLGVTPYNGLALPAGHFTLRLEKESYISVSDSLELVNDLVVKKSYNLVRLGGSLTVLSTPAGANIYLDGQEQPDRTPASLAAVPAGRHQVKIHLDRYYDAEQDVEVAVGKAGLVNLVLTGGDLEQCEGRWLPAGEASLCRVTVEATAKVAAAELESRRLVPLAGEFVMVPGGCFQMGDTFGDGRSDEQPVHEVCVDGFQIGKYEVTQGQWRAVMGNNPSGSMKGDNYPVETVGWNDSQEFINTLNRKTGKQFRLPTEAEWEYAARSGGKREKYSGSDNVEAVAWYGSNSISATHPVGTKAANGLGIYDMSGNVWEWCQDWYEGGGMFSASYYEVSPRNNPSGPVSSTRTYRVFRGGAWNCDSASLRATDRSGNAPSHRRVNLGFRLVLPVQ